MSRLSARGARRRIARPSVRLRSSVPPV